MLFVVCLFYLYIHAKSNNEGQNHITGQLVGCFFALWATVSLGIIKAYRAIVNVEEENKWLRYGKKLFALALGFFVITISGKRILAPDFLASADNNMHMPAGLVSTFDCILADANGDAELLLMPGYSNYATAYSSRLHLIYEEPVNGNVGDYKEEYRQAYEELNKNYPNMSKVAKAARGDNTYIVLQSDAYWPTVALTDVGFVEMGTFDGWTLYKSVIEEVAK